MRTGDVDGHRAQQRRPVEGAIAREEVHFQIGRAMDQVEARSRHERRSRLREIGDEGDIQVVNERRK